MISERVETAQAHILWQTLADSAFCVRGMLVHVMPVTQALAATKVSCTRFPGFFRCQLQVLCLAFALNLG